MNHQDFREAGVVSVWLGRLKSEESVLDYLEDQFDSHWGFEIDPNDGPEYDAGKKPKPIDSIFDGFSWSERFASAAAQEARRVGWKKANCVIIFYNFRFKIEPGQGAGKAPIDFVGSFPF